MTKSKIEWTDRTWNPTVGCARVSPGCEHCYAETMAARCVSMSAAQGRESVYLPVVDVARRRWNRTCVTVPERLEDPLRWKKPAHVFVNSMSDLFHEDVPFEFIAAVFGLAAATPQHTYQILTKRPRRARKFFAWLDGAREHLAWPETARGPRAYCIKAGRFGLDLPRLNAAAFDTKAAGPWPLPNVWLGVSVEDQQRADERIPVLLECPAALRFLSCEPLLGPVDLSSWLETPTLTDEDLDMPDGAEVDGLRREGQNFRRVAGIGWAIVGGESGPGARECDIGDVRSIVDQCKAAEVPVFVKQLGARPVRRGWLSDDDGLIAPINLKSRKGADPSEWPSDLRVQQMPRIGGR